MTWRTGRHYGIHVYEGDRPVATFHNPHDAQRAVDAVNDDAYRQGWADGYGQGRDDEANAQPLRPPP